MTEYSDAVKIIDELHISPPPASVPTTPIPLSFFDIPWFTIHPIQRVFFYDLPIPTSEFRESIIPNLTSSLSIALRYFYPFAGRFISVPWPNKPYIIYSDGDSVPFTVAESTALDFDQVTSDQPNDVRLLHPLLPKLPKPVSKDDGTTTSNILSVKVTLFPNSGICIGIEFLHVAADGMAANHFFKSWAEISRSWAEISRSGCKDLSWIENNPPYLDRGLIKDPKNLESIFLEHLWKSASPWDENSVHDKLINKVRATFVINAEDIFRLKKSVKASSFKKVKASSFVVASALVWINLAKSLVDDDDDKIFSYVCPVDARGRMEPKVPATYFGNCLGGVDVSLKRRDLAGDGGFVIAAEEIAAKISAKIAAMEREGPLKDATNWFKGSRSERVKKFGKMVLVAGSPKLQVYETDFGWGRPRKSEPVHIDFSGAVYFSDPRDVERGGIEFGLALKKEEMDVFIAGFEQQLKQLREVDQP
ncbi:Coumaroyl-CoA:anthocyanidin 3-O-glucoside-6''-O-coumaroyltransferase 1 [Linum perenne]